MLSLTVPPRSGRCAADAGCTACNVLAFLLRSLMVSPAVEDVNNCMGRRGNSSANLLLGPVPKSCKAAAQRLEDCLQEQQRLQELAEAAKQRA
jgi:hypothetical protein